MACADLLLVAVHLGGVDVPVADLEGGRSTAAAVSAGSIWNTPKPSCGISTPLFSCMFGTVVRRCFSHSELLVSECAARGRRSVVSDARATAGQQGPTNAEPRDRARPELAAVGFSRVNGTNVVRRSLAPSARSASKYSRSPSASAGRSSRTAASGRPGRTGRRPGRNRPASAPTANPVRSNQFSAARRPAVVAGDPFAVGFPGAGDPRAPAVPGPCGRPERDPLRGPGQPVGAGQVHRAHPVGLVVALVEQVLAGPHPPGSAVPGRPRRPSRPRRRCPAAPPCACRSPGRPASPPGGVSTASTHQCLDPGSSS